MKSAGGLHSHRASGMRVESAALTFGWKEMLRDFLHERRYEDAHQRVSIAPDILLLLCSSMESTQCRGDLGYPRQSLRAHLDRR